MNYLRFKQVAFAYDAKNLSSNKYVGLENVTSESGKYNAVNMEPSNTPDTGFFIKSASFNFSKLRPYLAKAFIAKESLYATTELLSFKLKKTVVPNYILYFMLNKEVIMNLSYECSGSKMPRLNRGHLENVLVPNLSLQDQTTIANYLDQHTASIDREVELLERRIELTEEYRQALIYETVTKGLNQDVPMKASGVEWIGDIPSHWEVKRLKELFKERKEKNIKNDTFKTDNVLSVLKDVGVVLYSEKGNVGNKMSDDITGYKIVKPGDLVLNKMNVTIGSLGISKYYGALSIVYLVLKGINTINAMYYQYVFRSRKWQRYLKTMSNGIMDIRESVDMTLFNGQLLLAPPLQEQNAIALYLDQETSKLDQKLELLRKKVELLKEYKQSLIYEAVTGKIPTSEM